MNKQKTKRQIGKWKRKTGMKDKKKERKIKGATQHNTTQHNTLPNEQGKKTKHKHKYNKQNKQNKTKQNKQTNKIPQLLSILSSHFTNLHFFFTFIPLQLPTLFFLLTFFLPLN